MARFEGRVFADGDSVRAKYRLVNTGQKPITIKQIPTSCSCMATMAEEGKTLPFVLAPGESSKLTIVTTANAGRGMDQSFSAAVVVQVDGEVSREIPIGMQFQVADVLRALPESLQVHELSGEVPWRSSFVLYTYRDARDIGEPSVRVRGSRKIKAVVRKSPVAENRELNTLPRFLVDVIVAPANDEDEPDGVVSGEVEVDTPGERTITVPISCSFQRGVRLQPQFIEVFGRPGERFDREIYQDFATDAWRDVEIISKPQGCDVQVSRFDSHTNRVRIALSALTAKEAEGRSDAIVLGSRDHSRQVRIPIRYSPEK